MTLALRTPIAILSAVVLLTACGPDPTLTMQLGGEVPVAETYTAQTVRFEIVRVGVFEDGLAYGNRRGVYVLTDNTTGEEFVGVSGIGISELGSHTSGKASVSDER